MNLSLARVQSHYSDWEDDLAGGLGALIARHPSCSVPFYEGIGSAIGIDWEVVFKLPLVQNDFFSKFLSLEGKAEISPFYINV